MSGEGTPPVPYGSWPSPFTAELIVSRSVSLGEVRPGLDDVWWSEMRPDEQGRTVVVRHRPGGERVDVLPPPWSARTRVHEYGGGAWWLHDDIVFFVNWTDQRVYRLDPGTVEPAPLTPETSTAAEARYADGVVTPDNRWILCVRELHDASGGEPANEIVAIPTSPPGDPSHHPAPVVVVSGPDFVAAPRISPEGTRLCWVQWDHPRMPWDGTELWVADIDERVGDTIALASARKVAGGSDEAIFQPEWTPDGALLFTSDRHDWWNVYRHDLATGTTSQVTRFEGDVGVPHWVFAQSRYAQLPDGRLACAVCRDGIDRLAVVDPDGKAAEHDLPYTSLSSLRAFGDGLVLVAGAPTHDPVVAVADLGDPVELAVLRPPRDLGIDDEWFSRPEPIVFPTTGGAVAHGLFYRPTNPSARGPEGERPPLVVLSHGGPTSAARPQLNLTIQYWTSRGIAVVDVNYRGSSGYGRAYRRALDGVWGIADVDDCIAAARHLVDLGEADGDRLAIRGGSAGGYTTLCALTFHDDFAAGASLYGVADLEALARDTHKFEARYLDTLVGPYPEARDVYVERSPIHHVERLSTPLILFQGLDDAVVPPAQAEQMVEALRRNGVPFAYLAFEGEQHGFRQAGNIRRVLEAELYFYAQVLGFELADEVEPVTIERP